MTPYGFAVGGQMSGEHIGIRQSQLLSQIISYFEVAVNIFNQIKNQNDCQSSLCSLCFRHLLLLLHLQSYSK